MLLAGDELLNSQNGNNNGYCQDNELTWINWDMTKKNAGMFRFVKQMIALRKRHSSLMRRRFLSGNIIESKGIKDISWHGTQINEVLWGNSENQFLAFTLAGIADDEADIYVAINMSDQQLTVDLPTIVGKKWCLSVNTSEQTPKDIVLPEKQKPLKNNISFLVREKSIIVLENI
jgi:glycogen operon protein